MAKNFYDRYLDHHDVPILLAPKENSPVKKFKPKPPKYFKDIFKKSPKKPNRPKASEIFF